MLNYIFALFIFALGVTATAFAQVVPVPIPENPADLSGMLPAIVAAVSAGKWVIVGAFAALVGTLVFRQYVLPKLKVSTGALPWVSLAISVLSGLAAHLAGGATWQQAASVVLVAGGVAGQVWSLGGKWVAEWVAKLFNKELGK